MRTQVAVAIPACTGDDVDPSAVAALIELTNDRDATGPPSGSRSSTRHRQPGCSRRPLGTHGRREPGLTRGSRRRARPQTRPKVVAAGGAAARVRRRFPSWLFDAAASLADSSLVPALRDYDQADDLVRRALSRCDAEQRAESERNIAALIDETQRLLDLESPGSVVSAWCDRLDIDVLVSVHMDGDEAPWICRSHARRGRWRTGSRSTSVGQPRDERGEAAPRVARPASVVVVERDHIPPKSFGVEDARQHSIRSRRRQPHRGSQQSGGGDSFQVEQIQLCVTP